MSVLQLLLDRCETMQSPWGIPFLMLGVCSYMVSVLEETFPDTFFIKPDRDHFDYIYTREKLATLSGKKLQGKRNHCNKFRKSYPNYEYRPLTKEMIPSVSL